MAKNKKSYSKVFLFYLAARAVRNKGAGVIPPLLTEVKSRELLAFPTDRNGVNNVVFVLHVN